MTSKKKFAVRIVEVENGYLIEEHEHNRPDLYGTTYVAVSPQDLADQVKHLAKRARDTHDMGAK